MTLYNISLVPRHILSKHEIRFQKDLSPLDCTWCPRPNQCYLVLIIFAHLDQSWINEARVASKAPAGY